MGVVEAGGLQMQRCVGMQGLGLRSSRKAGLLRAKWSGCRGYGQSWPFWVLRLILLSYGCEVS